MLKIKRLAAALLAIMLLLTGAWAEDLSATQPLLDITVAAALLAGDQPESIGAEGTLSEGFVYAFFTLGAREEALGISESILQQSGKQEDYIARAFACGQGSTKAFAPDYFKAAYDYTGVRVMSAETLDGGQSVQIMGDVYRAADRMDRLTVEQFTQMQWLDKRVVAVMRRDENAPGGWLMESLSWDGQTDMENHAAAIFTQTMVEYLNADAGFSLQYPAVFAEHTLQEDAAGVSGKLPDGSASFFARKTANTASWTLEKIMNVRKQENPAVEANINDISGCGRVVATLENGFTVADIYIVTEEWVYQAQLMYDASLAADFSLYSDYMMNSFSADELGIG